MNTSRFRFTALAFSMLLVLAACKPGSDVPTANGSTGAPQATSAGDQVAAEITGAGATFIYPLLSKWSDDYNKQTGHKINYQSIGSGGGIAQIKAATVDFGSSDKPLGSDELAGAGLGQFPSAIGGVVPVVNVEGIDSGKLRLTGALLAKGRVIGAQFVALFEDGLYFQLARHANVMAARLAAGLRALDIAFLSEPVTNQVFPILADAQVATLRQRYGCHVWSRVDAGHSVIRLVTSWATQTQHVDTFIDDLRALRVG
jgi:hypothetical protein